MTRTRPVGLAAAERRLRRVRRVLLVGSGKGGVGKSTIACCLALTLEKESYRTGLLDLDIHGASVPDYLGLAPPVASDKDGLVPKIHGGLKVMSVGLFTGSNPVPMRGSDKQELLMQLFGLTNWGDLDYLVVDLPPSMGDELLTSFGLFGAKSSLLLVTTPSPVSLEVVSRLKQLAEVEQVSVLGAVLNMAYVKTTRTQLFPFGRLEKEAFERRIGTTLLSVIPLEPSLSIERPGEVLNRHKDFAKAFSNLARLVRTDARNRIHAKSS